MSKLKSLAVLSAVSFRTDLIERQLKNYHLSHGDDAIHFLHVASDGDINADSLEKIPGINVNASSSEYKTSNLCNFGGQIANSKRLFSSSHAHDIEYVYIHTDADLIIQGNLLEFVKKKKCAYLQQKPVPAWPHYNRMMNDPCFSDLRAYFNISADEIVMGRQEGAFFPADLWKEMSFHFEKFYKPDFFKQKDLLWPVEEGIVPTLANRLIKENYSEYKSTTPNIVVTKPLKPTSDGKDPRDVSENCVKIEDINTEITKHSSDSCIAMKWFARIIDDPAAKYANHLLIRNSVV
ncbi:hypothetical protein FJ444_17865 [Aestuariibacter sp. GS-14]|uniref:hypothetical protein n=1 Tax=Aestuariibacter sp. GS-14 TaxID=2590670 RepID=UPI00112D213A|nr:hypothetical protein [Aestuariibacter sp. GS-14]TPV55125.1 hypothetical protein FJ444_17865 [Aestuariibacter sp. GS-14]